MKIERVTDLDESLIERIMTVWEASVRQTHIFLTEEDIKVYKEFIKNSLPDVELLFCAYDDNDFLTAFIGINGEKIEMLFVDPEQRGKGIGKDLLVLAIEKFGAKTVDVNEQNQQAVGFYEHLHFRTVDRASNDYKGKPYPLLTMQYFPVRTNAAGAAPVKKETAAVAPAEVSGEGSGKESAPEKKKTSLRFVAINIALIFAILLLVFWFVFPAEAGNALAYVQKLISGQ